MPFMDGYESCQNIRQFLFGHKIKQPIISAVTGHTEEAYVKRAILSGMNQVLSKPVPVEVIENLISLLGYPVTKVNNPLVRERHSTLSLQEL